MFKSIKFVWKENVTNSYRIYSIAKYEIAAEVRDSKLGLLWNVLNPLIQIMTYWFVFGFGIRNGQDVNGIPFLEWMLVGMVVWFFISPSLTNGVGIIHKRTNVYTKMKFPISILPTTIVLKELFDHLIMLGLLFGFFLLTGKEFSIYNLQLIYYIFAATAFSISITMVLSVLNMFTRDVKKIVTSLMRLLMYATPILWSMNQLPEPIQFVMKLNPIYYLVEGYRDSFFYTQEPQIELWQTGVFWLIVLALFTMGSILMYNFKHKFINMI